MWVQSKGKIVAWDGRGRPTRFTGTHTDITERKKVEEELRQLRNYLANIIDSMPSALVTNGVEGAVIRVDDVTERIRLEGWIRPSNWSRPTTILEDNTTSKGTGLGLSVSYLIITEDHGGEMRVYATENGGTRFVIRLHR